MKTEAEPGGMQLQAKEHRGLRASGHEKSEEAGKDPTQSLGGNPALLTLGFGTSGLQNGERINLCCSSYLSR